MGTGWRRAFCTAVRRDPDDEVESEHQSLSPTAAPSFLSRSNSNPWTTTPGSGLRCRTKPPQQPAHCLLTDPSTPPSSRKEPGLLRPSSPRSPSGFAHRLKTTLRLSRSRCGVCEQSVRTDVGTAVYTAECSHSFHFPCLVDHVRGSRSPGGGLACPTCSATWRHVPLLSSFNHTSPPPPPASKEELVVSMPEAALVSSGRTHQNYVVALTVTAPPDVAAPPLPSPSTRRAPIDLVAVLDLSETMAGLKLRRMKRSMRTLLSSLSPTDRLSIVAFSADAAESILPLSNMTESGQRSAYALVDRLQASRGRGRSADALRIANGVLETRLERNPVATLVLLSDGLHHRPPQDEHFGHLEIPISAPSSGEEEEEAVASAKYVGRLLSVAARDVHLQLHFPAGNVAAVYSTSGGGGPLRRAEAVGGSVWIGDLYAEETRELLVELRVASHRGHAMSVKCSCSYRDPATQELVHCPARELPMPPPLGRSPATPEQMKRMEALRNLFVATRAVADSQRLVSGFHDVATALHLLSSARSLLLQSSAVNERLVRSLEAELALLRSLGGRRTEPDEAMTPTSAWRAAERLAKMAMTNQSMNRVSDLHGFENARF